MLLRTFREGLIIACVALVAALASLGFRTEFPAYADARLSMQEVLDFPQVLWVDARSLEAYQRGHIPGAVWLSQDDWESGVEAFLSAWEPGQAVVVYCDERCNESAAVAEILEKDYGIESVYVLRGGMAAWQQAKQW